MTFSPCWQKSNNSQSKMRSIGDSRVYVIVIEGRPAVGNHHGGPLVKRRPYSVRWLILAKLILRYNFFGIHQISRKAVVQYEYRYM